MTGPRYVIAASVPSGNRVRDFHGHSEGGLQSLLLNPPKFRERGFGVGSPDVPRAGPDGCLEIGGTRRLLRVFQDGTVLLRVAADGSFLGWGLSEHDFPRFPRLNPVPVVEIHASFIHFYREILRRLKTPPSNVSMKLNLTGEDLGGQRLYLTPYYPPGSFDPFAMDQYLLQMDPAVETIQMDPAEIEENPDRSAFRVLALFASMFDMPEEEVPFSHEVHGELEVDIDRIRGLKG